MSSETTFLFSNKSLPEIAKAIGLMPKKGILTKNYGPASRITVVEDDYTEQTLLRQSVKTDEGMIVTKEVALNNLGVNISPRGVIFARAAEKGELVNFSKLTRDELPVIDSLQKPTGGIRKAARAALEKRRERFGSAIGR
ncbi:MAG: hypothetical protein A3B47_04945 [Candidatus Levybacteria bacterium RIFCSPLOWO2_01_FULL_39_24]|nr:MAG: hypothetical protein A2800_04310 [Candidatus Levybacteria bacterium RIFCSPHIGHO2_01_FULL_40_16]OGH27977.1 MAG: hypothetical protein A3E12_02695 [Candidatus Levybacteria bacterium RIFCSPHIGHO2_12_FULL_39_9]OGH46785.1 MAG: hypothetical protein A3B47_04945 [Candidatus Levybacteria bacterium RIFCSPLOWO2_01_FULL_39_24]